MSPAPSQVSPPSLRGEGLESKHRLGGRITANVILPLLLVGTVLVSLGMGRFSVPIGQVYGILLNLVFPVEPTWTETASRIVTLVRLPRVILAVLVGGGLALCGAAMQGIMRNPLVGPHVLGVMSAASLGGVLAILFSWGKVGLVLMALVFGIVGMLIVYSMSRIGGRSALLMLVLSGVVSGAFFSACVSVLTYIADPYDQLPTIVFWLMGSLAAATYDHVWTLFIPVLVGGGVLIGLRWRINVLSLGDEEAEALGIQVEQLRWVCLTAVGLIVAGVVAVSGVIGWVGLVAPHMARMLVGPDHRILLPSSFLLGGIYLTWMDNIARTATAAEIPLGVLTALIGAPMFFYLLRKTRARGWVD